MTIRKMTFFPLLLLLLLIQPFQSLWALEGVIKGFIALDLLGLEKIEGDEQSATMGIGVVDLKVYAHHEKFSAKIKLDVDSRRLDEGANLFEEALASYGPNQSWRFNIGKGKVPFHQIKWGVLQNSYIDGGSILGTENSYRDIDRRLLFTVRYGGYHLGLTNYFTIFGNSQGPFKYNGAEQYASEKRGFYENNVKVKEYNVLRTRNSSTFNTKEQIGVANKFEFYPTYGLTLALAGLFYHHEANPKGNFAFDLAMKYRQGRFKTWASYLYGFTSTHVYDRYATFKKYEHSIQWGGEFRFSDRWALLFNLEASLVVDRPHDDPQGLSLKDPRTHKTQSYKAEFGPKISLARSFHITFGILHEQKYIKVGGVNLSHIPGVRNPNRDAYLIGSKLSFWF